MSDKSREMIEFLDSMTEQVFGRSRSLAIAGKGCVNCGKPAGEFRDEISRREFGISGLCQACQDKFFGE